MKACGGGGGVLIPRPLEGMKGGATTHVSTWFYSNNHYDMSGTNVCVCVCTLCGIQMQGSRAYMVVDTWVFSQSHPLSRANHNSVGVLFPGLNERKLLVKKFIWGPLLSKALQRIVRACALELPCKAFSV